MCMMKILATCGLDEPPEAGVERVPGVK